MFPVLPAMLRARHPARPTTTTPQTRYRLYELVRGGKQRLAVSSPALHTLIEVVTNPHYPMPGMYHIRDDIENRLRVVIRDGEILSYINHEPNGTVTRVTPPTIVPPTPPASTRAVPPPAVLVPSTELVLSRDGGDT